MFGPASWVVIYAATRVSGVLFGRTKRMRETPQSVVIGEGWTDRNVRLLGLLLGVVGVTTPLSYATLELPLAAALEVSRLARKLAPLSKRLS